MRNRNIYHERLYTISHGSVFIVVDHLHIRPVVFLRVGHGLEITTHYDDVIMGAMASQITSLAIVYSTVYSGTDQRKHQSSASLVFVRGIHR